MSTVDPDPADPVLPGPTPFADPPSSADPTSLAGPGATDSFRGPDSVGSSSAEAYPSEPYPSEPDQVGPMIASSVGLGPAAAFDPGRRGRRALAAVAVLIVAIAAIVAWQARPRAEPVAVPQEAPPGPVTASGGGLLVVAVSGQVHRPGLVRLPPGARVADAIDAAGGALPGTDLSTVNLARKVNDGELVTVGGAPAAAAGGPPVAGGGSGGKSGGKLNLNTATVAELDALPGVGQVLAQRIVEHRDRHGPFRAVGDLRKVDGIGDARFEQLKDLVVV